MDLSTWMAEELGDMSSRLGASVLGVVPLDRHKEHVDGGGSTITSLLWHLARHQDIAINAVVRRREEVLSEWAGSVGATGLDPGAGLAEAESQQLTDSLDPGAVVAYYEAVCSATAAWLPSVADSDLDTVPQARSALTQIGVVEQDYPWLHNMWDQKPTSFHIRWEAIAHGVTHTGEMVSMRNRMGLSPF